MARLTAEFWVAAYLARLRQFDIPAFVAAHGDATSGNIMVKMNTLDGSADVFQRSFDASGKRVWMVLASGTDMEVEKALLRQRSFDPDIWIIEVEDKHGRHLLDEPGLAD